MINYYILVTTDAESILGTKIPAFDVIENRIKQKKWPIYDGTSYKKLYKTGDLCLIYVGGAKKNRLNLIGYFEISGIENIKGNFHIDAEEVLNDMPTVVLNFKKMVYFSKALNFKELLPLLSFNIANHKKWGVLLMGGARKISKKDFKIIIDKAGKL